MRIPALLLASLPFALAAFAGCATEAAPAPAARPAVVEKPKPADDAAVETYAGEVHARYESVLGFRIAGKLERRAVDVGARVRRGDVLAVLEPEDFHLQATRARAQVAAADADLALAQAELDRHVILLEKRYISRALYDARLNQRDAAKAQLESARAELAVAENQTGYSTLRADHDGVITAIAAEVGQVVAAGQPVVTLAQQGERDVLISVPESRVARFAPGQAVAIEIWAEDNARTTGRVREVAPEADSRTRTYDVRVAIDPESTLAQLGMTARVFLLAPTDAAELLVPMTALHEKAGTPAVWVLDAETRQVRLAPVTVVEYGERGVTLAAGLDPDAWIVTAGVHKLVEGQAVRPIDRKNRPVAPAAAPST